MRCLIREKTSLVLERALSPRVVMIATATIGVVFDQTQIFRRHQLTGLLDNLLAQLCGLFGLSIAAKLPSLDVLGIERVDLLDGEGC